jgi:riboflavin synthase
VGSSANALNITAGCQAVIQLTTQGETATDTARIGDKLCSLVAIPIFTDAHDQIIGTLVFGEEMGRNVAQELSTDTGGQSCTALLAGGRVIATTLPGTKGLGQ